MVHQLVAFVIKKLLLGHFLFAFLIIQVWASPKSFQFRILGSHLPLKESVTVYHAYMYMINIYKWVAQPSLNGAMHLSNYILVNQNSKLSLDYEAQKGYKWGYIRYIFSINVRTILMFVWLAKMVITMNNYAQSGQWPLHPDKRKICHIWHKESSIGQVLSIKGQKPFDFF